MSQTFYKTDKLSLNQKIALLNRALQNSFKSWVDIRKPNQMARQRSLLTVSEVLLKFTDQCHFVFIDRGDDHISGQHYFETGFSTLTPGDSHFLFIYLDPLSAQEIIQAFNLNPQ